MVSSPRLFPSISAMTSAGPDPYPRIIAELECSLPPRPFVSRFPPIDLRRNPHTLSYRRTSAAHALRRARRMRPFIDLWFDEAPTPPTIPLLPASPSVASHMSVPYALYVMCGCWFSCLMYSSGRTT